MIVGAGTPERMGLTATRTGVNVAIFSAHATRISLCVFDGERETRWALPERSGDVHHGAFALPPGTRYGLRAEGPYAPEVGHRFNANKLLIDPHALGLDRVPRLHPAMYGARGGGADMQDSAGVMPKCVYLPGLDRSAPGGITGWGETVIYELHVRGFSMRRDEMPAELRGRFSGLGHPASIAHLVRLGVTAVEVMPPAAWIEEPHLLALGLTNAWGYNPVAFLAPDARLAPGGWGEIRATVAALAAAGIETIVDIVLNHTGEGDADGPTLSLRGLDNASYYRLAGDPLTYVNDTGTGNMLALDRAPVMRLAMDALRAWAELGGVHGFRFDLAPVLGRRAEGFDASAPLLAAIGQDPVLCGLKMIAEPWDIGPGGYQLGNFPGDWGEWNGKFRDDIRSFWRSGGGLGRLATRLAGSDDVFAAKRRPSRGVNFVTSHDGFTLADLVACAEKHNWANGEGNRDGTDENFSWNNGVEGASDDPAVAAARMQDQRALLALLLFARGTPMLGMGIELGFSQNGNNNAYCQDNAATWIDWDRADDGLMAWTAALIGLRRALPGLRRDVFLSEASVAWLGVDGPLLGEDWDGDGALAMVLEGVGVLINQGARPARMVLPGSGWRLRADSAAGVTGDRPLGDGFVMPGRAVLLVSRELQG